MFLLAITKFLILLNLMTSSGTTIYAKRRPFAYYGVDPPVGTSSG